VEYAERAYNIYREIGNIARTTHAIKFTVDDTLEHKLPCNLEFVEAVSTSMDHYADNNDVTVFHSDENISPNGYMADILTNSSLIQPFVQQTSDLHPKGEYIPYELEGSPGNYKLRFDSSISGTEIICIYRGVVVDREGNPILFRKEAEAIAAKLAFIYIQKRMFMKDPTAGQILPYIKGECGRLMAAAKIPEYMTQNDWNRVLTALTSHNRKVYHRSFKTMQ